MVSAHERANGRLVTKRLSDCVVKRRARANRGGGEDRENGRISHIDRAAHPINRMECPHTSDSSVHPIVTHVSLADRIAARVSDHGLVASDVAISSFALYLTELARWNQKVNLTAIPLQSPIPQSSIDKLIVEPLVATTLLGSVSRRWLDLGSGGGSPAIPLRIVWRSGALTMVESRERKGVFLRDVARSLRLSNTVVETLRFQDLPSEPQADLVTLRAVRIDAEMVDELSRLMSRDGLVLAFGGSIDDRRFVCESVATVPDGSQLRLLRHLGP